MPIVTSRCSPFSFSCSDGGCTSLEAVCDFVPNCVDESDEEERFCQANNRCEGNTPHQCNLLGEKCISRDAVCDGRADCENGGDEVVCQGQAGRKARDAAILEFGPVCPALSRKEVLASQENQSLDSLFLTLFMPLLGRVYRVRTV